MSNINIRPACQNDRPQWDPLWRDYIRFYESMMTDEQTETLWQRIHDPENAIQCRVAEDSQAGKLVGMVHFFPHASTWNINPVCYLNDLFVSNEIRGAGIGEALINAVVEEARDQGWEEVYWLTQNHNSVARGLYDKLTGGSEGFVNYSINTSN
jgi:GNAT superfamily N-acetyltransferase